jgi:hypothetical protein
MRAIREREKTTVYIRKPAYGDDAYGDVVISWGDPLPARAQHQPMSGGTEARVYGESLRYMRMLFYDGPVSIAEGDGVCVFVGADEWPDYRVHAVQDWPIPRYDLKRIPPEQREVMEHEG